VGGRGRRAGEHGGEEGAKRGMGERERARERRRNQGWFDGRSNREEENEQAERGRRREGGRALDGGGREGRERVLLVVRHELHPLVVRFDSCLPIPIAPPP
jgi:hypothetical protein